MISAYILTRNEAHNIVASMQSLQFADEIIVIDTGSDDDTIALAKSHGATVFEYEFNGFGDARNFALTKCHHDWVICLDADERITDVLQQEINQELQQPCGKIYCAPRQNFFLGRWIKHSGWYPDYRHPILFNKHVLQYTNDAVHESFISDEKSYFFKNSITHYPYQSLTHLLNKSNLYSSLGVKRLSNKQKSFHYSSALSHGIFAFIKQYILQRGFLDGWPGFILAMNAFHATFYRYAKFVEANQA